VADNEGTRVFAGVVPDDGLDPGLLASKVAVAAVEHFALVEHDHWRLAAPEPRDVAVPHGRRATRAPHSDLGLLGRHRHAPKRLDATGGTLPDNDSWSTNELDIDWQGVTLYNLYLARWWAARARAN
jgi:hypothetical protein